MPFFSRFFIKITIFGFLFLCPLLSFSLEKYKEHLGVLTVYELNLKPRLRVYEPKSGGFEMGDSSFTLSFQLSPFFRSIITVGDLTLINSSSFFSQEQSQDTSFGFIESYASMEGRFGIFKMGLIPLSFGLEGDRSEKEIILPRSMVFSKKVVALRDYGISYEIAMNHFFSQFIVHNGESSSNKDGRLWITGKWGYENESWTLGLKGQVGETTSSSTSNSSETRGNFNKEKNSKIRIGGVFFQFENKNLGTEFEYYFGEVDYDHKTQGQFAGGQWSFRYDFSKNGSLWLREDIYDPLRSIEKNRLYETSLGVSFSSEYMNSTLSLVVIKKEEDDLEIDNNEVLLTWKLAP